MSKKNEAPLEAYGTELAYGKFRSNHPIRSRHMASALAFIFGIIGVNQFYLRNIVRGILKILLTVICVLLDFLLSMPFIIIPIALSVIAGVVYLVQTDEQFAKRNHVRPV